MNYPRVSIIILNWNGWKDTVEALESLYQIEYPNYHVVVVDNHSVDDSIERIREYCDGKLKVESPFFDYHPGNKPVELLEVGEEELKNLDETQADPSNSMPENRLTLIKNHENHGFAEGNNVGMRYALKSLNPDFILLLNNDTVVDPIFLDELVKQSENAGIAGSKIYFYHDKDLIQSLGFKIKWSRGEMVSVGYRCRDEFKNYETDKNYEKDLDAVSGCSMLVRREVLDEVGLFNKKCFLYYEDTDLCLRAKRAGFKIVCADKSKLWHKDSASSKKISGTREYYSARNLFLFMRNYAAKKQFYTFLIYFFCFKFWFTAALILLYHRETSAFKSYVKGISDGLKGRY
ncbi:Glycosyltransferase like family 2 [anaerobic digester metagenome]